MNDITHLFNSLLQQYDSIDIANSEFKKLLHEDEALKEEYSEWCHAVGSTEKKDSWIIARNIFPLKIQSGILYKIMTNK